MGTKREPIYVTAGEALENYKGRPFVFRTSRFLYDDIEQDPEDPELVIISYKDEKYDEIKKKYVYRTKKRKIYKNVQLEII